MSMKTNKELKEYLEESLQLCLGFDKYDLTVSIYDISKNGFCFQVNSDEDKIAEIKFEAESGDIKMETFIDNNFTLNKYDEIDCDYCKIKLIFYVSELILQHRHITEVIRKFVKNEKYIDFVQKFN